MKTYIAKYLVMAAFCFAACFDPTSASGASYAVGISPNNDTSEGTQVFQSLLVFMLDTAAAGDELSIVDALNQKLVARFVIPEGKLFQGNARARAQRLAPQMAAIKQFILAERSYPRAMASVIALPQFLDFAATQLRRPGEPLRIIVLASPFYIDVSGDGACNMDAAFPSDAHLISDQQRSVFGCALRKNVLNGVTVHYAFLNARFLNDYHQERITRFWALYCQQTGGALCSFCPDRAVAFQRAAENIQQPCVEVWLDSTDTKFEMRQVVRRSVPLFTSVTNDVNRVAITSDIQQVVAPPPSVVADASPRTPAGAPPTNPPPSAAVTQPPAPPAAQPPPTIVKLIESFPVKPTANKVGIGIAWAASVDLDLWVRANPNARELYFHNTATREGRYFRDWRDRNMGTDYEYVELNPTSALDLAQVGCWVNYYEGKTCPVGGVVVVFYEGKSYYSEFTLNAPGGNKAGDKDKRNQSRYWVRIDLGDVVRTGNQFRPAGAPR